MGYNSAKELMQRLGMPIDDDGPVEPEISWDMV